MLRVERRAPLGAWSYEVADTKLARETRAGTILQLGLYSELLGVAQGRPPEHFYVVTPDPDAPIHALPRGRLRRLLPVDPHADAGDGRSGRRRSSRPRTIPSPWITATSARGPASAARSGACDDHLSLVAGISRLQRRELESREHVRRSTNLAGTATAAAVQAEARLHRDATSASTSRRASSSSRAAGSPPLHELRAFEKERG